MRINLTVEVESRKALATILRTGAEHSLTDYCVQFCEVPRLPDAMPHREPLAHTLEDYRNAPAGIGPVAAEWRDKPHRLIYDLCGEIERLRQMD